MRSFYCDIPGGPGEVLALAKRESDHLFKILRAAPGDTVELLDGRGRRAVAQVRPDRTLIITHCEQLPEPKCRLLLYTAVPRKVKLDVLLKQAAELGVWEIHLVTCERSVALPERSDRWETLLMEGCKQSGNPFLPRILPPVKLSDALANFSGAGFFGAIEKCALRSQVPVAGNIGWFVGPEGGFTASELEEMAKANLSPLNLGPYVLRLETAAVAGLAVLRQFMAESGE